MKQKSRRAFLLSWWVSGVVITFGLMAVNAYFVRQPPFNDLFFVACFSLFLPSMLIFVLPLFMRSRQ